MLRFLSICALAAALSASSPAATTPAFPFTYYIHDTTGVLADTPLPSIYQFSATALGSNSNVVLKVVNTSTAAAFMGTAFVASSTTSTVHNTNFTVTGLVNAISVPAGGSLIFTVNFSPLVTGPITAYLQTSYQVQQNGCSFTSTDPTTQCPGGVNVSATLTGAATQPQLVVSYQGASGSTILQPSGTPLNFGNVSTSGTFAITFTLSNQSTVPINAPSITVPAPTTYSASPFLLDISQVPASIAAGTSANFTITFEPGQTGLATTYLLVGSNSYPIQGEGVVIADIDALQISDVDATGVRGLPQAATPISFGQIVAGSASSSVLTFTLTNPTTSYNAVSISHITVSGAGFVLYTAITGASSFPASVAPGASIIFKVAFSPTASGSYTGSLSIGARVFSLSGLSISSPLPAFSLVINPSPLTSQEQATAAIQFAAPSTLNLLGTILLAFSPSVPGASGDSAIMFLTNSASTLSLSVASGAQTATNNGQSALAFQTGTTAGVITFAVAFPNTPTFSQSFTIPPAAVQITSASAQTLNPNLVVTMAGYDNTYSAGQVNFTFYDTSGNMIAPIAVNATSNFQSLFFTNNSSGGAFSLQAVFPVTGDITKIGTVAVSVANSVGQANTTLTFQ